MYDINRTKLKRKYWNLFYVCIKPTIKCMEDNFRHLQKCDGKKRRNGIVRRNNLQVKPCTVTRKSFQKKTTIFFSTDMN